MGLFNIFKAITSAISKSSSSHQLLSSEFEKCANNLEKQIDGYIYFFLNKLKTPEERQAHLLKEQFESIKAPFHWELRQKVFKQMVEKIQAVAPNSPYFLALQEVTPEALSGLKKTLADKNLQWISFNNLSGKKTLEPGQESVAGEATSFTTTLALSPDLEVLKTELGDLPTESGSIRKILGVKVRNKHSHQVYHLFTTHTDHVVQKDLYTRTAKKIHEFASHFFKGDPHKDNVVLGGDLNAFEDKGGASYLQNLINLFKGYKDFRETDYYAPPQIACSSSIGRSGRSGNPKINKQGFIERNALDHILIGKGIKLTSATREALVYDDTGALLDYYQNKDAYIKKLQERQTFSDHLFNVVVFA
jgi:endonuclease/exonuclease/phosphatase family metal-dependent hydrolase